MGFCHPLIKNNSIPAIFRKDPDIESVKMISIVVPLFNKALHIERAIQSVIKQSYKNFELIVVNDGSTDKGPEIVKRMYDSRIMLIHQDNAGVSAARNRGIAASRGDMVAFLDADDEWKPDFLETINRLRNKYPGAGIYATAYNIVNERHSEINPKFIGIMVSSWEGMIPSYFRSAALGTPPVSSSASCVPKIVLIEMSGFSVGRRMGEDLDLWGRIALHYPIAFSSKIGAVYYKDAENRACALFRPTDEHPFIETVEALRRAGRLPAKIDHDVELYLARLRWENMRQHVLSGNLERAREISTLLGDRGMFVVRRLLWGSRLNSATRFVWQLVNSPRRNKQRLYLKPINMLLMSFRYFRERL